MHISSIRNASKDYTTHRYRQQEEGTVIKVVAVGDAANDTVRALQEAGSGMIDEFIYIRVNDPAGAEDLSEETLDSLRDAASGSHLLLAVLSLDNPDQLILVQECMHSLASNGRLVVCIPYPHVHRVPRGPTIHAFEFSRNVENSVAFVEELVGTRENPKVHAQVLDSLHQCIRTLTDVLDSNMIGIDFDDLRLAMRNASRCRFSRGIGESEDKGAAAVQQAISGLDRDESITGENVLGIVALIEAQGDSLKMRDYKLVMDGLREAFGKDIRFAVNMITRDSMAKGAMAVNLVVASTAMASHNLGRPGLSVY